MPQTTPREFGPTRQVWLGQRETGIAEVEMFGWGDHMQDASAALPAHQHGAYEFCLIKRGEVEWWAGLEVNRVAGGEVYLTRPGEVHGGVDSMLHRSELFWVHLAVPGPACNYGLSKRETAILRQTLAGLTMRKFTGTPAIRYHFQRLHEAMPGRDPLANIRRRNIALALALEVVAAHDLARARAAHGGQPSAPIRRAMDFIAAHLAQEFRIDDAAGAAGMGLSRFHDRFVAEVGLSPGDYRTRLRIRRAKELLLQSNQSVTHIAMSLGFASSQYFATVFRRVAGMTPGRYRADHTRGDESARGD